MMRPSVICEPWDIAVVPFPFTDGPGKKRRPAVVLSTEDFQRASGHTIMAMITSAQHSQWPGDVLLLPGASGLPKQCFLRMKFFTLDSRLIVKVVGKLTGKERQKARASLEQSLSLEVENAEKFPGRVRIRENVHARGE